MSNIIRIKRSETSGNPNTLAAGELAYSGLTDNGSNGGDRLYIGLGTETSGNAANHIVIGGKFFTDRLNQTAGVLTASAAIVVDSNKKIDDLFIDNIELNGNTISTTNTNGDLLLSPNGTGKVSIAGAYTLPRVDGSANYVLTTNGAGIVSWAAVATGATSFTIAGDTGSVSFNTGGTLTFVGTDPIDTAITSGTVTISAKDATTGIKGVASFNSASFAVTSGDVTIKSGGVSNAQLVNSSVTIGTTSVSLGTSITTIAGLTSVTSTTFVGALTGNASTVTNGVYTTDTGTVTNTMLAGSIANSKLSNSSVTIGSTSVSLGATATALAGLTELTVDNININGNTISSTDTNGNISLDPNGLGSVDVNGAKITNVGAPTADSDAANKAYVDNAVTGLTWKDAVNLLADSNIALTGSTNTLSIDGHSALTQVHGDGYRILLKNQSTASQNGIYLYSDNGSTYTLTRTTDADVYTELKGASIFIMEGTTYGKTGWVQSNHYITDFSTQNWVQFSGAGSYSGGNGLSLTGSTFDVNVATNGGIEIAADALQLKSTVAGNGLTLSSGVLDVVGTSNRISVSADAIDISSSYVGQTSITTLGTVSSGTWSATTIATTKGGTGLTSFATGDLLYASGSNTLAALAASTNGKVLQLSGGVPTWGDIDGGTY